MAQLVLITDWKLHGRF